MEEYYKKVCELLKEKGFDRKPDYDTVKEDYISNLSVEDCVEEFIDTWN